MSGISSRYKVSIPILLLQAAAAALAWAGADFSPGFSEGLAAVFVTAGAASLFCPQAIWGRIVYLLGAFCIPVGTYIYAAGEDHLSLCLLLSLIGTAAVYAVLSVVLRKTKVSLGEHLLRIALLMGGLFSLLCGVFSTALLPVGFGLLLCFTGRCTARALPWLTAAGLLLTDVFLVVPMCFGGMP